MTKSIEIKSDLVKGQVSSPYINTGKHLLLINWTVTSSEAVRPTCANIALTARQKDFLASSSKHINTHDKNT